MMFASIIKRSSCRGFTALLLVFALVVTLFGPVRAIRAEDNGAVAMDVSGFSTTDIYGTAVNGGIFAENDITVIHYFATWYPASVAEMSFMQTAHENFQPGEVGVYGLLEATSSVESCKMTMESLGYTYTCLTLDEVLGEMAGVYPLIPQTFFIDKNGIVVEHFAGIFENYDQLEAIIEAYVGHEPLFHSVVFIDGLTNEVIERVMVANNGAATAPTPPEHDGYVFSHWDGDFSCVTANINVYARYIADTSGYALGDVNMDGSIDINDVIMLLRGTLGIVTSDGMSVLGDMDSNGSLTVDDVVILLRKALGITL